jgi:hypothetical protein
LMLEEEREIVLEDVAQKDVHGVGGHAAAVDSPSESRLNPRTGP